MNSGIYKWVSPNDRVYIGQSKDLNQRIAWYKSGGWKKSQMPKLKRSFNKYGFENHIFEIVELCSYDKLNEKEIYWGLFYNTLELGLNCKLGEQNCIFSESTKYLMSQARLGTKQSEETRLLRIKNIKETWDKKIKDGFIMSEDIKKKMSLAKKNKKHTDETIKKMCKPKSKEHSENISKGKLGKSVHTEESKNKLREIGKLRDMTKIHEKCHESNKKPINQYNLDGEFIKKWESTIQVQLDLGIPSRNISNCLTNKSKTSGGFIWKFTSQSEK